jgi:hypothetical protein
MDEVTHLPDSLQKLLKVTVGMEWPEGNEAGLRAISQAWSTFSQQLQELDREVTTSADQVAEAMDGDAAEAFRRQVGHRIPEALDQLQQQAEQFASESKNAAADIQKTKIMVVTMLTVLAATIAELIASLFGSVLIPGVVAAARVGIGALLRELATKLAETGIKDLGKVALSAGRSGDRELAAQGAKNLGKTTGAALGRASVTVGKDAAKYAAGGAAFMGGLDLGIQGAQDAAGERDGIDWSSVEHSVVGGAIGGGAFGVGRSVGRAFSSGSRRALEKVPEEQRELLKPGMHVFGTLGYAGMQVGGAVLSTPLINLATGQSTWAMAGAGALSAAGRMGRSGTETGAGASAAEAAATGESIKDKLVSDGPSESAGEGAAAGDRGAGGSGAGGSGADGSGASGSGAGGSGAPVSTTSGNPRGEASPTGAGSSEGARASTPPPAYSFMGGGAPVGTEAPPVPDMAGAGHSPQGQAPFGGEPVQHQVIGGSGGPVGTGFTSPSAGHGGTAAAEPAEAHPAADGGGASLSSFLGGGDGSGSALPTTEGAPVEHGSTTPEAPAAAHTDPGLSAGAPHGDTGAEVSAQPGLSSDTTPQEPAGATPETAAPETAAPQTAAGPLAPPAVSPQRGAPSSAPDPGGATPPPVAPRTSAGTSTPGGTDASHGPATSSPAPGSGAPPRAHQPQTTSGAPSRADASTPGTPDRSAGSAPAERPSTTSGRSAAGSLSPSSVTPPPESARSPENADSGAAREVGDQRSEPSGRWDYVPDADASSPRWVWAPAGPVRSAPLSAGDGPRVVSRANFVEPDHGVVYADQRFPGVSRVNARAFAENRTGHRTNCADAMVQIENARRFPDRAVRGEFRAGPSEPITPRELLNRGLVRDYRFATDFDEVESHVLGLPHGARVPVFFVHENGSMGHYLLAENREGVVHYLDNTGTVIGGRWPAKQLLYGRFPEGGELPPVRGGFAQDGSAAPGPDAARDVEAPDVPGGSGPRRPEATHEVEFERGSKELSPQQRGELDAFVDDLVHRGRAARRAGEPLPEVTVTGRGNGSRMPWSGLDTAQRTARERANAVRSAVRERLAERLDNRALPRSDLRSDDFRITARSAGADHGRAESDSGRAAEVALHPTGPQMIVGHAGHDAEPVPRELHMNWFGDRKPLAGPLGEQIRAWQEKAGRSGWRLHLWVDDRAAARNAEYLAGLSGVQVHNVRDVLPRDTGEATGIPPAAVDTFHYALDRGAYNLSSDVARYAILHQRGGVYLDVDLAPGELELPREPVRMSQDGIPFLAPEIRDENQAAAARTNLVDADPEHWAGRTPTDQDVVDWQYRGGNLTNNLIISPRGSSFLHGLLRQLPDVDTLRGQASDLRRNAAHLTGPHRVQRHLEQHLRDRGLRGRLVEEFRSGRAAVDPDLVHHWAHRLQWVTDESGDQLHDEHETASTSRTEAGSAAAGAESGVDRESGSPRGAEPARAAEPGDFDVPRFGGSLRDPGPSEQGAAVGDDAATGADGRPRWLVEATRQPWSNMADVAPFLQMEPAEPHGGLPPVQEEHDAQSPGDGRGPVPEYTREPRSRVHEGVPWDEVTAESDRLPPYSESPPSSELARSEDGDPRDVPGGSRPDSSDEDEVFRDVSEHPPAEGPEMSSTLTDFGSWSQEQPAYAMDDPGSSSRSGSAEHSPVADVTAFVDSHPPSLYSAGARGAAGSAEGSAGDATGPAGDAAMRHGRRQAAARRGDPGPSRSAPGRRGHAVNVPEPAARPWIHLAAPLVWRNGAYEFSPQHVVRAPLIDRSGREVGVLYNNELFASRQHPRSGFHERFTAGGGSDSHTAPWGRSTPTSRRYARNFPATAGGRLPSYDELYGPPERALDTRDPFSVGRAFGEEGTNPEDAWEPTPPYSETLGAQDARRILGGRAEAGRYDGTAEPGGRPSPAESQPHPTRTDRGPGPARSNYRLLRGNRPDRSGASNVRGWGGELPRAAAGEQHPIPEGAVARGSFADDGEADRAFARHYADVLGVNADRFWRRVEGHVRNCFASLVATSQTLATGRTVAARAGDRTAVADAERYFGDRFRYSSLEEITGHMRRQDPGAQGAVFLQRRDGTGHYVLVHTRAQTDEHGRVVTDERNEPRRVADFVDGHRGSFADLRGAEAVAFMPIRRSGTEPLPEAGAAPAEEGAGLRGSLGGGHGSSRVAQDRERRIRDRYGIPVGSQYGEHSLSPSVLGRLERVLDALPASHLRDNPSLRGIVRSRERGSASAYFPETETIEISHPFGMPGRMYVALDRGVDWQLSTMDQAVIRSDEGADARRDAELGLRHGDRHVMGGVSRVLAHGNLVEWTLRHEIGHSVDRAAAWAAVHSHEPRFGGWRFEGFSASARRNLARTILQHAGLPDTAMGLVDRSGRSTVQESLAAAVRPDSARSNDVVRLPREFEHHGRQVRDAVERAVRFVRIAASSPWMFDDGRARDLTIGDRIYQIDSMGRWTSYLAAARRHALSNYQFSARDEWFAEAYAAHHDPDPRPRTRLDPAVRDWFDRDLPEALTAHAEQSGRVRGQGGEPSRAEAEHWDASAPHQPAPRDASSAEPPPPRADGERRDVDDAQHDPAALARRARTDGAELVGTLDGRGIRAAIDRLADSAGPELRELIEHAFSDRNLTAQLSPRARDGAYAVDFTPGGTRRGPRVAVELTGLRRRGEHTPGTADFGRSRERAGHVSTAASQRAHVGSDSFSTRIPTPIGVFMAKILGLVDRSEGGLSVTREHAATTTVTERDVPATAGEYDATYRVTVSKPGRAPWSRTTTRTDYVDASAPLAWPRETGGSAEHRLDFRAHDLAAVEDLEFSGLGEVTSAVSGELGLRQHEERELRAWLDRLGSEARLGKDVFADGAHETFHFRGRATRMRIFGWRRSTRVRVFVADGARVRALPEVDGEVEHRESARTATTATQSKTRRRGFGAGALFGDFTGTTAAAAGPVVEERGSTRNASGVTDEHERETVATYAGPLAKRRADVTFLVGVGDAHQEAEARPFVRFDPAKRAHVLTKVRRYEPKNLVKVDGGVTMWMRPHRADELGWSGAASEAEAGAGSPRHPGAAPPEGPQRPAPEADRTGREGGAVARTDPANDPVGATRHDIPDRTDARTRIPQRTAEACAGAVLHELAARGHVPARELPALKKRLLDFLAAQENAGEITSGGDGALFELSALVPKAPDVFLSAEVDRPGAEYLGVAEERFSGAIRSAHENDVEITKAREASRGLAAYGVSGHEYPVGQATYETGTEHTQRIGQQLGHEQPFPADQRPHRYRYPVSLRARIGGSLVRDSGPDVAVLDPIRGSVEVTASELPGIRASTRNAPSAAERGGTADASTSAEGAGGDVRYASTRWYDGEPPPDASAFAVPTGAEAASHKPIPHQVRTAADMLGGDDRPRGWRRWSRWPLKPLVGAEPPRFHEHRGSRLSHPRDGAPQERNPALPGLVGFGTRAAREAGAGLAESFRDSRTLLSHNRGGLLGSRDASGRVELDTRTSNPRVVSGPVEHTFTRTSHAQTDPGTGARKTRGGELSGSTMRLEAFSNWLFFGTRPVIDLAARSSRTTGKTTDDVSRTTTTTRHTERSYLLRTDETHVLRTSRRHNWQDPFSAHHRGPESTAAKWIRVPDNEMWVPASELPAIPGLTEGDLAHLHPEDAARYREAHPVAEHRPAPDSGDRAREPESALRPPDDVGRGSGRVELHRAAAVRDLVRGIEQRLDQWSREHGRPNPGRRLLDLAREAVGKPPTTRPERVAKFDAINARLVHDVLGPAAAPRRFDAALDEMLNGGRSVYLEGETAFGKVEQLVVLRARLGPGEHHRTVPSEMSTTEHGTTRRVTEHDQRGQTAFMKLGISPFPGVTGKPASLALPGVFARFRRTTGTDRFHEHRENVTTTREGPAVQFLHDLTVEMEVYPYARPGTYTRLLGTWAPSLVPRRFGQPWRAEFPLGPGAVRSTVSRDEALPVDEDPTPPLDRAEGSLRQQQVAERGRSGFSADAQVRARPMPASRLREALRELAFGDPRGASSWPGLRPRAAHQLLAATSSGQLGSHLRRELSDSGYVVPLVGDRLEQVRLSLDAHRWELLDVLDEATIHRATTRVEGGKPVSESGWEVGFANAVDFREMNVGDAPIRPDQLVSGMSRTVGEWTSRHEYEISTAHPDQSAQQRRYVVRLHPRWRITPTWRGKKVPEEWQRTVHVDEDDPIVLDVNRAGLDELGLRVPEEREAAGSEGREAVGPEDREPGERAEPQQDARPDGEAVDDPLQDWLLYEQHLLGDPDSAHTSTAASGEPGQARASLSDFLRGSGGTAPADRRDAAGPG